MKYIILTFIAGISLMFAGKALAYTYYYPTNGYYRGTSYTYPYYRTQPNYYTYDNYSYRPSQPKYNSSYYNTTPKWRGYTRPTVDFYSGGNAINQQFQQNQQKLLNDLRAKLKALGF